MAAAASVGVAVFVADVVLQSNCRLNNGSLCPRSLSDGPPLDKVFFCVVAFLEKWHVHCWYDKVQVAFPIVDCLFRDARTLGVSFCSAGVPCHFIVIVHHLSGDLTQTPPEDITVLVLLSLLWQLYEFMNVLM